MSESFQPNVVVLISGTGSNMSQLIQASQEDRLGGQIQAVISNNPDAPGILTAQKAEIATQTIEHGQFESRQSFELHLKRAIDEYQPDLIVLAGFMRILSPEFVRHYHGRMLNIHPSLLPKYKGLNTHKRAIEANELEHGCTVHFVTEDLDGGPAIIQASVAIDDQETETSLQQKVQTREHEIYPIAVKWFLEGRLSLHSPTVNQSQNPINQGPTDHKECRVADQVFLDGKLLPLQGIKLDHQK